MHPGGELSNSNGILPRGDHWRWRAVGGRPEPSADLLRQLDDDALRAADVAEPIAVFIALHRADELRSAGSQASHDGVDCASKPPKL